MQLSDIRQLPTITIDQEELSNIPLHLRLNYVLKKYFTSGNILEKSVILKYLTDNIFNLAEASGNEVLKAYVGTLKSGLGLFELNTVISNLFRISEPEEEYLSKRDMIKEVIKDNYFKSPYVYTWDDNTETLRLIAQNIYRIPEEIKQKYNIKIHASEEIDDMYATESIIVCTMDDYMFAIYIDKSSVFQGTYSTTKDEIELYVPWPQDEETEITNSRCVKIINLLGKISIEIFAHRINPNINYVTIDQFGYQIHPKKEVNEIIRNLDYNDLIGSIEYCIENNKKRGIAIVGSPGLGKSLLLHKIINHFNKVPTFVVRNEALLEVASIRHVFSMVKDMKAILVIDDFDGLEVQEKGPITNEFLHQLDVNGDFKGVVIATVNDPSKVHYTLIARPERFDEVHLMRFPEGREEVIEIINNKLERTGEASFINEPHGEFFEKFIEVCTNTENTFSHARISSTIDYCLSHFRKLSDEGLYKAAKEMIKFAENAKLFSDNGELKKEENRNNALYAANPGGGKVKKLAILKH